MILWCISVLRIPYTNVIVALRLLYFELDVRASYMREIICDNMAEAEDAEYLEFSINPDEVSSAVSQGE